MNPTVEDVQRAVAVAKRLQAQGYFAKVKTGDERAASYFTRLVAAEVNPTSHPNDWGALAKPGGGFNVEGFADGAMVFGNHPDDLNNVLKIVVQVGSTDPNAIQIGSAIQPRRQSDIWSAPTPLAAAITAYLLDGGEPSPVPVPQPVRPFPSYHEIGDDAFFRAQIGIPLQDDALTAGETLNDGSTVWSSRGSYLLIEAYWRKGNNSEAPQIAKKLRNEWRAILRQAHPDKAHLLPELS